MKQGPSQFSGGPPRPGLDLCDVGGPGLHCCIWQPGPNRALLELQALGKGPKARKLSTMSPADMSICSCVGALWQGEKLSQTKPKTPVCLDHHCRLPAAARGPHGKMRPGDEFPDDCKLYVGNLSPNITDETLKAMISPFGTVLHAIVLMDQVTQQSR